MHCARCINVAKCAHDQCSIFNMIQEFFLDYGLLLELHAVTQVARSYALLLLYIPPDWSFVVITVNTFVHVQVFNSNFNIIYTQLCIKSLL